MKRLLLALMLAAAAVSAAAEELRMTTLLRGGDVTSAAGRAGIFVRDVLGDSRPEIVTCASGSAFALSWDGSTYRQAWYSPEVGCTGIAVADLNGSGAQRVIVGADEVYGSYSGNHRGWVYVFDPTGNGQALATIQVSATLAVNAVAAGNVDNDAAVEIVAVTSANTYVIDSSTMTVQWTAPWGGTAVEIGDVEGDGVNEVIVNGSDGHVLNAAAQLYKWGYAGGFGTNMAVGDVDADGRAEIVGGTSSQLRVIHGDTFTVNTYAAEASGGVSIGDANADGQPEIVVSTGTYSFTLKGWSAGGTLLWSITDPSSYLAGKTAVGDPDGDGVTEIVWADNGYSYPGLAVSRVGTNTAEWRVNTRTYNHVVAGGDLDGDGDMEVVIGGSNLLTVRDVRTGAVAGTITVQSGYYSASISKVAVGQVDADPAKEIIVLVSDYNGATIFVYDGVTLAQEWKSNSVFSTQVLAVANLDDDPVDEIVVASYNTNKFQVLNGSGGFIQKDGPTLDGAVYDVAVGDLDGDGILDLAVGTTLSAYVYKVSDWTERKHLTTTNYSYGVSQIAITAGQLATYWSYEGKVRTYDGTTLAEIRACATTSSLSDLAYATFGGRTRLVTMEDKLRLYDPQGASCPVSDTAALRAAAPFSFTDVTGDGRPEILAGGYNGYTVASLAWNDELHGDADRDGVLTDGDIDALASYLYGNGGAFHPAADVNGDSVIRADDLFYLINYRKGTGSAPP